jgi:hypothetical protein
MTFDPTEWTPFRGLRALVGHLLAWSFAALPLWVVALELLGRWNLSPQSRSGRIVDTLAVVASGTFVGWLLSRRAIDVAGMTSVFVNALCLAAAGIVMLAGACLMTQIAQGIMPFPLSTLAPARAAFLTFAGFVGALGQTLWHVWADS